MLLSVDGDVDHRRPLTTNMDKVRPGSVPSACAPGVTVFSATPVPETLLVLAPLWLQSQGSRVAPYWRFNDAPDVATPDRVSSGELDRTYSIGLGEATRLGASRSVHAGSRAGPRQGGVGDLTSLTCVTYRGAIVPSRFHLPYGSRNYFDNLTHPLRNTSA